MSYLYSRIRQGKVQETRHATFLEVANLLIVEVEENESWRIWAGRGGWYDDFSVVMAQRRRVLAARAMNHFFLTADPQEKDRLFREYLSYQEGPLPRAKYGQAPWC